MMRHPFDQKATNDIEKQEDHLLDNKIQKNQYFTNGSKPQENSLTDHYLVAEEYEPFSFDE